MPEVPALKQMVTRIAQVGSGAIAKTTKTIASTIANTTTTPPRLHQASEEANPPLRIPDGFFRGYIARHWDPVKFARSFGVDSVHYVLVPQPRTARGHLPMYTANMISNVEVASTPTADTPGTCLVVQFPHARYLFGHVAEGSQRILIERKINMSKMANLFLTGPVNWQTTGGLMGMILTLADTLENVRSAAVAVNKQRAARGRDPLALPSSRVDIHGGRNLVHTIATTRRFVFRRGTPLHVHEIRAPHAGPLRDGSTPDWQDDCLQVWYLPVANTAASPTQALHDERDASNQLIKEHVVGSMFNSNWKLDVLKQVPLSEADPSAAIFYRDRHNRIQQYKGPFPGDEGGCKDIPVLVREPWPATTSLFPSVLPPTQPSNESLCYIVKTHPRRGRFDPIKAEEFGVRKRDYKLLTAGQNAKNNKGVLISPDMVVGPSVPGNGFVVADLRDEHQVQSFIDRPEWADETIMQGIVAAYWILSDETSNDKRLVQWMQDRPDMKHIMLAKASAPNRIAFERHAKQTIQMHQIDPERFPLPLHSNEAPPLTGDLATVAQVGRPKEKLHLAGRPGWEDCAHPFMNTAAVVDETLKNGAVAKLAEAARQRLSDPAFLAQVEEAERGSPAHGVVLTALGTGSSLPSKLRNVSGNLVQVPFYGNYLFDCGENTLGQLRRSFGHAETDAILEDLRVLYISHAHADHHLGAASVLARRAELVKQNPDLPPLTVVASSAFTTFVQEYGSVEDLGLASHVAFLKIGFSGGEPVATRTDARSGARAPLPTIDVCAVDHCQDAMACVFTWPTGLRVAYSGDCRPSDAFAALGRGAHLLIHECTFDSDLQGEAVAKKHSTMAEALDVGRKMHAKRILLTHFSQRYPKLPVIDNTEQTVLYAFDLMRIKLQEFKQAALFLPALQKLLDESQEDGDGLEGGANKDGDGGSGGKARVTKPDQAPKEKESIAEFGERFFRREAMDQKMDKYFEEKAKKHQAEAEERIRREEETRARWKREEEEAAKAAEEKRLRDEEERRALEEKNRRAERERELMKLGPEMRRQKRQKVEADTWAAVTGDEAPSWWSAKKSASPSPKRKDAAAGGSKSTSPAPAPMAQKLEGRRSPSRPPRSPIGEIGGVKSPASAKARSSSPIARSPSPTAKKAAAGVKRSLSPRNPVVELNGAKSPQLPTAKRPSPTARSPSPAANSARMGVESPSPARKSPTKAALQAGIKT